MFKITLFQFFSLKKTISSALNYSENPGKEENYVNCNNYGGIKAVVIEKKSFRQAYRLR